MQNANATVHPDTTTTVDTARTATGIAIAVGGTMTATAATATTETGMATGAAAATVTDTGTETSAHRVKIVLLVRTVPRATTALLGVMMTGAEGAVVVRLLALEMSGAAIGTLGWTEEGHPGEIVRLGVEVEEAGGVAAVAVVVVEGKPGLQSGGLLLLRVV